MPFQGSKRVNRKRRRNNRKGKKRGPTTKTLSKKVRHIENNLIELKFKDEYAATTAIPAASSQVFNGFQLMQQGDTASTRTGNVIQAVSIIFRFAISTLDTLVRSTRVRVTVFWDTQANGAAPTAGTVYDTSVVTDTTVAPRNQQNINRYIFLWDKIVTLNLMMALVTTPASGVVANTVSVTKDFVKHIKLSRQIRYDGNAGTIADLRSNVLYIAFTAAQVTNTVVEDFSARLYFRDG